MYNSHNLEHISKNLEPDFVCNNNGFEWTNIPKRWNVFK